MNAQEIFDRAYLGVMRQGHLGVNYDGSCCYADKGKAMCGVGHVLGDEWASKWEALSGLAVADIADEDDILPDEYARCAPDGLEDHLGFLCAIQDAHDTAFALTRQKLVKEGHHQRVAYDRAVVEGLPLFEEAMRALAVRHGLTVPETGEAHA